MALNRIKFASQNTENEDIIKKEKKGKEGKMEAQPQKNIIEIKREIREKVFIDFYTEYKKNGLGIPEEKLKALEEKIDALPEDEFNRFRENYNKFALSGSYTGNMVVKNGRKVMEMDAERDLPRLFYFIETVFGKDNRRMIENGIILKKALKTRIHPKTKISVINNLRRLYSDSERLKDDESVAKARAVVRGFLSKLCNEKVKNEMAADEMDEFFHDIELYFLLPESSETRDKFGKDIEDKINAEWHNFRNNGLEYAINSIFKIEALKKVLESEQKEYLAPEVKEALTFKEQEEKIKTAKLAEIDAIYDEFEKVSGSKEKRELSVSQRHILNAENLRDRVAMEVSGKTFDALQIRAEKSFEGKLIQEAMNYDAAEDYCNRAMARYFNLSEEFSGESEISGKTVETEKVKILESLKYANEELDKKDMAEIWKILSNVKKAERTMKKLLDKKAGRKSKKLGSGNIKRIRQLIKAEEEDYVARNLPEGELKKLDFLDSVRGKLSTEQILAFKRDPYKFIDDYYIKQYNKNQKKEEK